MNDRASWPDEPPPPDFDDTDEPIDEPDPDLGGLLDASEGLAKAVQDALARMGRTAERAALSNALATYEAYRYAFEADPEGCARRFVTGE